MSNDLVSIITPSYNTANFVLKTIESVVAQTHTNWEMIIVDDCSTDDSVELINDYIKSNSETRIRLLIHQKNLGAAVSRNFALGEAKGTWIAFLDSDDLWLPEKLEKQIAFMKMNNCNFSYTNYIEIDSSGKENGIIVTGPKIITKTGMYNYCWPGCNTVMYNRDIVGLIQIHNIKMNNDYAMWLKVCRTEKCYLLNEVHAKYRRGRDGSISNQKFSTMIGWHYKLFHEAEEQNAIVAGINTIRNLCFGYWKKIHFVKKGKPSK